MEQLKFALPTITAGYTKTQLKIAAENIVKGLMESGYVTQAAEAVAAMENFIKEIKSQPEYIALVRDEVAKSGKIFSTPSGTKIELAEVGTKYDFSNCEDQLLLIMEQQAVVLSEKVEARKAMLKTVPLSGMLVTDEETGDTYKVYPPSKTSTSSYKVTLAK